MQGSAEAVASFNVVDSQYATLFAEEAAREKAARTLIERIERNILLRLNDDKEVEEEVERRQLPQIEFNDEYSGR